MKKVFKNFVLPTLLGVLAVIFIGMGCTRTTTPEEEDGETPPEITVISPINNARFYTDGGEDTPSFIDIEAEFEAHETGLDENLSNAIIYKSNVVVRTYGDFLNNPGIHSIGERFQTSIAGEYKIVFTIVNREGTQRTKTIWVTCVYSELQGGTDTN